MKLIAKSSYILAGLVLMLSSCAQEDSPVAVPDGSDRRIIFHTSLPEVTSRASEIVTDLTKFCLTVYDETDTERVQEDGTKLDEFYDCLEIEKEAGTGFVRSDLCVWPKPGQESDVLHFFACYPRPADPDAFINKTSVSEDGSVSIGYGIRDYVVAPDIADQVDFVTAYTTGSMADNLFKGITLNFAHQLSRIEVKAFGSHKSCDIEIAGVRLGGVGVKGDFDFYPPEGADAWTGQQKGKVEYVYREGDEIVTFPRNNTDFSTSSDAVSLMGDDLGSESNCAMLIPARDLTAWNYVNDRTNSGNGMYISVLLRVVDPENQQQYPYKDNNQGLNALDISVEYFAVDKATGKEVSRRLYKKDDGYFTDKACTAAYSLPDNEVVKEFGWASVPVSGNWEPGKIYTYTLNYTYGVGVHDPSVGDAGNAENYLKAGDPIISDRVGVSLDFKDWQTAAPTKIEVPGN